MLRNFLLPPMRRRGAVRATASLAAAVSLGLAATPAAAAPSGRGAAADDAEQGRRLLAQYQCGRCHAIPGVASARSKLAVPLASFGARSYIAGRLPNTRETLARWIVDPPSLVPGTLMPNLGVSPAEAARMAAYLMRLR